MVDTIPGWGRLSFRESSHEKILYQLRAGNRLKLQDDKDKNLSPATVHLWARYHKDDRGLLNISLRMMKDDE